MFWCTLRTLYWERTSSCLKAKPRYSICIMEQNMFIYYVNSSNLRYFFKMPFIENVPDEEDKQKGSLPFCHSTGRRYVKAKGWCFIFEMGLRRRSEEGNDKQTCASSSVVFVLMMAAWTLEELPYWVKPMVHPSQCPATKGSLMKAIGTK